MYIERNEHAKYKLFAELVDMVYNREEDSVYREWLMSAIFGSLGKYGDCTLLTHNKHWSFIGHFVFCRAML